MSGRWSVWDHETGKYYGAIEAQSGFAAAMAIEESINCSPESPAKSWYVRQANQNDHCQPMPIAPAAQVNRRKLGSMIVYLDGRECPVK